jgi:hypothetical protein
LKQDKATILRGIKGNVNNPISYGSQRAYIDPMTVKSATKKSKWNCIILTLLQDGINRLKKGPVVARQMHTHDNSQSS